MPVTKTRETDEFSNVFYTVREDDEVIGRVWKTCSGYRAELPSGAGKSTTSIKKAVELIQYWRAALKAREIDRG